MYASDLIHNVLNWVWWQASGQPVWKNKHNPPHIVLCGMDGCTRRSWFSTNSWCANRDVSSGRAVIVCLKDEEPTEESYILEIPYTTFVKTMRAYRQAGVVGRRGLRNGRDIFSSVPGNSLPPPPRFRVKARKANITPAA